MKPILLVMTMLAASVSALGQTEILKSYLQNGLVTLQQGKYPEAERLFRAAISEIGKTPLDLESRTSFTLVSLNGLGLALVNQQKYPEAETAARREIELMELSRSPDNPDYAVSLNNLGLILSYQRKFAEAIVVHRKALSLREKYLNAGDPNIAISLLNLGKVYFDQDRRTEAEALLTRAVAILTAIATEEQTDENMLALANCDLNLALIKTGQRKYKEAEEYLIVTLTIRSGIQGPNHVDLVKPLAHYADLLRLTNRPAEALRVEARAKSIIKDN